MTRDKDRKRIIRNRMKKTGESYTTARVHVLSTKNARRSAPSSTDLAAVAGMSDNSIAAKTGRDWRQWVRVLDADGAADMPHSAIARLVSAKHRVGDWWAQTVTVGYERIKGLRERGQRRDGTYEASKNRTFAVTVAALYAAWADDATRRLWLDGIDAVVRTRAPSKSIRLRWPDGTRIEVGFTPKGPDRSVVAVAHTKLRDRAASARAKQYWADRLDALAALLART
jgi:hypothetical protein